ncbi:hypothetical protein [Bordetella genomosp. 1]|uniref:Uncharacterized protein n=1 Tax=Bordetella genomosp. 1 TaxID=1395607 RepID=A0ABX4EZK7_9BORD|nr:hypothetical protein [Bordetella genomosp. 1]OZI65192.1 hypothetical protein CAL27_09045 [Bordetella genomosp. 1]
MIPVAFPSGYFYLTVLVSFLAGVALVGWLAVLAFSGGARAAFGRRRVLCGLLMLALGVAAAFDVWLYVGVKQIERKYAAQEAALQLTLDAPRTLGGIAMPAGTRLRLERAGHPESYVTATFPAPVGVRGVPAASLSRNVQVQRNDAYAVTGTHAEEVVLRGAGTHEIDGWRCDLAEGITLETDADEAPAGLRLCKLGPGNDAIAGLPAGAALIATHGTLYGDGFRADDVWRIDVDTGHALTLRGLALDGPSIYLDAARRLVRIDDGALVCPLALGEMRYPAGTRVRTAGRVGDDPAAWLFSPWDEAGAERAGHDTVPEGMSVLQGADGAVRGLYRNEEVGVVRFMTLIVDGAAPAPTRAPCPAGAAAR